VNTIQGTYGSLPTFSSLLGTAAPSTVPGGEGCFEVVAASADIPSSAFQRGDWVIPSGTGPLLGSWRTHALVSSPETALFRVPDRTGLTPVQAATATVNPCSAYRMLRDFVDLVDVSVRSHAAGAGWAGGAWFVQNGANSGVGRAAIQLAALWGLRSINVVRDRDTPEATAALKDELRALGATVVVTETELLDKGFAKRVKDEWTNGGREPLLLALNCVGGRSAGALAKCLDDGGTMVTYGAMSKKPVTVSTGGMIFKDLRFMGFWLSRWGKANREGKRKTVEEILSLIRDGKLKDVPLQEIKWDWTTDESTLTGAVQGTLDGFRSGKGVFVFGDT
jgi:trans-2-enoyl-CoA reductase